MVTVLNWLNTTQVAGPQSLLLTCNITLGFTPSMVTSAELGTVKQVGAASSGSGWWGGSTPGVVYVRLTVGAAFILSFHKKE